MTRLDNNDRRDRPMTPQTHTVQYGPPGRYYTRDEATGKPVFYDDSKSAVIADAERRNGWPVTGSESTYADRAAAGRG